MIDDTRPRERYRLPDGRIVRVILDHGERPPPTLSYELTADPRDPAARRIVIATRVDLRPWGEVSARTAQRRERLRKLRERR